MQDWVLCEITSKLPARDRPTHVAPRRHENGKAEAQELGEAGPADTLNDSVFDAGIGRLSAAKHAEIAAAVRSLF